ncbi:Gamma-tubulin complex component 5 [Vitis vinifera]|uniref:Gamma-tubulin complex component n=1 Tax=Vitis vinifera TaxID=29760 RepID=A0A438ERW9_VITVI|nr:Gamma-tubulin complex component 5 [Vitis vinifera]
MYAATCLKLVEILINKVEKSVRQSPPTLKAFACSISTWLKRLRDVALKEETKISNSNIGTTPTLLGLASGLSSLCSGAEYLLQVVHGAIPQYIFEPNSSVPAAEMATHILDHLYKKLNEVCHMQGGEEEAYQMLLFVFVGSLLPYIEGLDSWLYEGTLDDPCNEVMLYIFSKFKISLDVELSAMIGTSSRLPSTNDKKEMAGRESISTSSSMKGKEQSSKDLKLCPLFVEDIAKPIISAGKSLQLIRHVPMMTSAPSGRKNVHEINGFGSSYDGNISSKIHRGQSIAGLTLSEIFCVSLVGLIGHGNGESLPNLACSEKIWFKFLVETLLQKGEIDFGSKHKNANDFHDVKEETIAGGALDELLLRSSCPENPVITICKLFLNKNRDAWSTLNLSRNFYLPPLNDEGESPDVRALTFPENSTLSSRVLTWLQSVELKVVPLPVVIMQECLIVYIKKQVDYIGRHILSKLMNDWRLMDELGVLRAIYLLGSGDLLQHFLTVLFNKLDKGESWDDDFELNTILQESIRNSADGMLLTRQIHCRESFGIDGLDLLKFTYKVSWPLELIANTEAIKKYNQVMGFLLKVKRAKFVLDKARRWMWKGRGTATINRKHHWLVEQKLLHFVDAFHQYVMDRVSSFHCFKTPL